MVQICVERKEERPDGGIDKIFFSLVRKTRSRAVYGSVSRSDEAEYTQRTLKPHVASRSITKHSLSAIIMIYTISGTAKKS